MSKPFEYNGNKLSLVKREIEIANPDVVIFLTGPSYALSMSTALEYTNTSNTKINGSRPTKKKPVVKLEAIRFNNKDIKVIWTYHPGYLAQTKEDYNNSLFNVVIDKIKSFLKGNSN